jgi:hypothetical protein
VCLDGEEKGQIGGSNVVWEAGDDGNAGSTAQPACGFREPPPSAIVYAVPQFIGGMSGKLGGRGEGDWLDRFWAAAGSEDAAI